jgi:DNA replication and repair protein RecF
VLWGPNAQGKTNFLEAIYYIGTLRSFRAGHAVELIRFGAPRAELEAAVERQELARELRVVVEPRRRVAEVDGKAVRSAAEYCGSLNAVVFAPEDLGLPKGSPAARRRFLDRAVFEARPAYLTEAQAFQRLLKHRNALLRRAAAGAPVAPELLEAYDERLAAAAAVVVVRRRELLVALAERFASAFASIARMGIAARLRYVAAPEVDAAPDEPAVATALAGLLAARRDRDLRRGYTSAGPQADDVEIELDGRPARLHASQGQLRALVLALKCSEILHVKEKTNDPPVLLLDDVSSELDPERNAYLFELVGRIGCQTVITTTDRRHLALAEKSLEFQVVGGIVQRS